jgi:hypothetical protein
VKALANVDTPNGTDLCHSHQEIKLCGFQTERAKFMIVDAHENTIEYACTTKQTLTPDLINDTVIVFHFVRFHFHQCVAYTKILSPPKAIRIPAGLPRDLAVDVAETRED